MGSGRTIGALWKLGVTAILLGILFVAPLAQAVEPVTVGVIQPLTGWAALDGHNVIAGMDIALKQVNEKGGVLGGRPLKLIIEDGKADPVESVNAVQKLITRDRVPAMIGCWASSATLAAMPIVKRNQIPLLVETSTAPMITTKDNPWVFRFTSHNDIDGQLMGEYLVPKLGFKKSAYLAVNNDWGRSMAKAISGIMQETGGEVSMVEYCSGSEANFTPVLTRIQNADVDSMFITTSLNGIALIMKQYHELGMEKAVFITSGMSAEKLMKLAGKDLLERAYFFSRYVPTSPPPGTENMNREMLKLYNEMHPDDTPDTCVASGFDAVHIMARAIDRAGSADPQSIRNALAETDYLGLMGRNNFDETGHSQPRCSITQIQDGVNKVIHVLHQ